MLKRVLYLVGPTCSGKSTIANILQEKYGYNSIMSTTTRSQRSSDNLSFTQFLEKDVFKELIEDNKFIEHATYSNEYYGTLESSMLNGFKKGLLAVKVIEVNGLVQILKSGFHETSGIDFFIVYLQPMFSEYETHMKGREDWETRIEEDKVLYSIFKRRINGLAPNNKHKVVHNKGMLDKVVSSVNNLCIHSDKDYKLLRRLLYLPESVDISKSSKEFDYSLSLIDSNTPTKITNYFITSRNSLDLVDYFNKTFNPNIHYVDEGYIAMSLVDYGMLVVISKATHNSNIKQMIGG